MLAAILAVFSLFLGACSGTPEPETKPVASPSPAVSPVDDKNEDDKKDDANEGEKKDEGGKADQLIGKWQGPEGTYLNINKKDDKYSVEIANLDGPRTFEGIAKGDVIEFTRDGKTETIKAASGEETGMKGFEKASNCVVVTKGSEGFCKK